MAPYHDITFHDIILAHPVWDVLNDIDRWLKTEEHPILEIVHDIWILSSVDSSIANIIVYSDIDSFFYLILAILYIVPIDPFDIMFGFKYKWVLVLLLTIRI